MKQELTPNQAAHLLLQDENAFWTYNGAVALCEYLEDNFPDMDFNVIDIRCAFNEYKTAWGVVQDYSDFSFDWNEDDEDEESFEDRRESEALEYLQNNTTVVVFDGGIIIQGF